MCDTKTSAQVLVPDDKSEETDDEQVGSVQAGNWSCWFLLVPAGSSWFHVSVQL